MVDRFTALSQNYLSRTSNFTHRTIRLLKEPKESPNKQPSDSRPDDLSSSGTGLQPRTDENAVSLYDAPTPRRRGTVRRLEQYRPPLRRDEEYNSRIPAPSGKQRSGGTGSR